MMQILSKKQLFATFACLVMLAISSYADPITFSLSGIGNYSLGTTNFTDSPFTISLFADTANVVQIPDPYDNNTIFLVGASSSSIDLSGIGTGNILADLHFFVNQENSAAGITTATSVESSTGDLFDITNAVGFATYDLRTSLGPLSPVTVTFVDFAEPTTLGQFGFTAIPQDVTFTAVATPEPASVGLFGFALLPLMLSKRKRFLESASGQRGC
jgi:hypothetical protein